MTLIHWVPRSFVQSPFYEDQATFPFLEEAKIGQTPPFYFDILYTLNPSFYTQWPWETEKGADLLINKWESTKSVAEKFFRTRHNKMALPHMIDLTEHFICTLFWSEGKPVQFSTKVADSAATCLIAPVNVSERLAFICESPDHYHAFVQLTSLFDEARKKRALLKLKRKI